MREIGTIEDEARAARLVDHLRALDIESEARRSREGWGVWVHREDQVDSAKAEMTAFQSNPDDARYRDSSRVAREKRRESERKEAKHRKNTIELRDRLNIISPDRCPVVHGLIVLSILLGLVTWLGTNGEVVRDLAFAPRQITMERVPVRDVDGVVYYEPAVYWESEGLAAIRRGELWRLWAPMFIHHGPAHFIFNMISLYWIGGLLELRKGWKVVLALALAASPVCLLGEYLWDVYWRGDRVPPHVVGMSGVIFALFGYAWMKSDYEPESHIRISTNQIIWMLGWLFLCMTGAIGPIANAAHVVGLVFGMLVALTPHLLGGLRWR